MIKEALEYIVEQAKPNEIEHEGELYTDKPIYRVHQQINTNTIHMNTLTSLIDYLRDNSDRILEEKAVIQVVSPTFVKLFSQKSTDKDLESKEYVTVKASIPEFCFGQWYGNEEFTINVMSKFITLSGNDGFDDKAAVLQFAGTVQAGTITDYGDNGVSQSATVKTGILEKEQKLVPSIVELCPYRTFMEVEQPKSQFIFRMRSGAYDCITCALFEADGGAWQNEAMQNIKCYLVSELEKIEEQMDGLKVTVIA